MTYYLRENYHYVPAATGSLPSSIAWVTVFPGLVDEVYARSVMGRDFARALELGVLTPAEDQLG